jgi:uncharacterized membrane protein
MERRVKILTILSAITVIGLILRFYNITYNSFWLDESATVWFSTLPSFSDIAIAILHGETNPPAFYWIEYIIIRIFGSGELALRLIPAIAGILLIPVTYYIGEEIWDETAGFVAAAFMAISPWLIYYSQEARAYTLAILFFSIGLYYWFRFIKTPGSSTERRDMIYFPVFMAIAVWFHFYAAMFLAIIIVITVIIRGRDSSRPIGISVIVSAIPIGMMVSAMQYHTGIVNKVMFTSVGFNVITDTAMHLLGFNYTLAAFLLIVIIIGLFYLYNNNITITGAILALTLASTIISGLFTILFYYQFAVVPRYLGYMLPLLAVCIGVSTEFIKDIFDYGLFMRLKNLRQIYSIGLILMILIASIPSYLTVYGYNKPQWHEAADYIKSIDKPGDYIVPIPSYRWQPIYFYYDNQSVITHGIIYSGHTGENLQYITATKNESARVFFVISPSDYNFNPCFNKMISWMNQNTETKMFYELNVSVYSGMNPDYSCDQALTTTQ